MTSSTKAVSVAGEGGVVACSRHAGGMQVGRAVSAAGERGCSSMRSACRGMFVRRQGMQSACRPCRWGRRRKGSCGMQSARRRHAGEARHVRRLKGGMQAACR